MDLFKEATKKKLTYATKQGAITTQDLWDLPLKSAKGACLDDLARSLNAQLKAQADESFVDDTPKTNGDTKLAFDVVLEVIASKKAEAAAKASQEANKAERSRLLEIIAAKKDESLRNLSLEELEKKVASIS